MEAGGGGGRRRPASPGQGRAADAASSPAEADFALSRKWTSEPTPPHGAMEWTVDEQLFGGYVEKAALCMADCRANIRASGARLRKQPCVLSLS